LLGSDWLDCGAYANVYRYEDEILKIFEDDKGYLAYLEGLSKLQEVNSYAPVINYVKVFTSGNKKVGLVSMEPLIGIDKIRGEKYKEFKLTVHQISAYFDNNSKNFVIPEELVKLRNIIKEAKKSNRRVCYDIHIGNIMLRANNSLVVTDPLAY
jgi:hypothetical protein